MKKTLTVNISGIVFHIDEDAYNVLNDYLQSIRQHFSRTEATNLTSTRKVYTNFR